MASVDVDLLKGLQMNGQPQRLAVLRELGGTAIMEASEASEKLVQTADGPQLVGSPARMGSELLARQIERIGEISGPFTVEMLGKLSGPDLLLLQQKSDELDSASLAEAISQRGRDDPAGAGSD